jgi:pimeloyl-ACP methyl ester carboxylesterase
LAYKLRELVLSYLDALTSLGQCVLAGIALVPPLPGRAAAEDDGRRRWDGHDLRAFSGTYGDYLLGKVAKVFPSSQPALTGAAAAGEAGDHDPTPRRTMMSSKPNVVLVHGFWGGAAHWGKVIIELNRRGYDSLHAVENPLTSLYDDAERTQKMIKQTDGPVLLAGHSYGGAVITQAGDLPNVVGLVYVAAFAPDAGESVGEISGWNVASAVAAGNVAPDSDGYVWIKQDKFHESFCQDLADDEALVMAVTQKAPLGSTNGDAVTDPAWKTKPSWYQVSADDRMIHPDSERRMAKRMSPRSTIELAAGHASLASQPTAIADFIDQAAAALA